MNLDNNEKINKYQYGMISRTNKWYVRLAEWKGVYDHAGDLLHYCRVLKIFRTPKECIDYIDWLKEHDKKKLGR